MEEKPRNDINNRNIKMTAETMKQDIVGLFGYLGMPNQAERANGSFVPLAQAGYALGQVSKAKDCLAHGDPQEALRIIDGLHHFPALIRSNFRPDDNATFYTRVEEPVSPSALIDYSIAMLNKEISDVVTGIADFNRKLNKTREGYVPGNGDIVPVY